MASIYLRGNTYWISAYIGKRIRKSLHTTDPNEAERLRQSYALKESAVKNETKQATVAYEQFKDEYLAHCRKEKKRRSFLRDAYAFKALEQHFQPDLITDITPKLLTELKHKLRESAPGGKGYHGINRNLRGLKTAMYWAEQEYDIPHQNWKHCKTLPVKKNREEWYTQEQLKSLLTVANGLWRTAVYLGCRAGLRPAEMYHLRAENVDLDRRLIHVTMTRCDCTYCTETNNLWVPKTEKSDRWIPIETDLYDYLLELSKALKAPWLISDEDGHRPTPDSFLIYLRRVIKSVGLRGSAYTLRHTFASQLVRAGRPLKNVAELMGHTTVEMTERYAHLAPREMVADVHALPEVGPFAVTSGLLGCDQIVPKTSSNL